MIQLNDEQRQQLSSGRAVVVTDSQSSDTYVVLRKDTYERVCNLLYDDSDWTEDEMRQQLARAAQANGWNEPGMEAYDSYDEERRKQCR
jgi:hypothetical protein